MKKLLLSLSLLSLTTSCATIVGLGPMEKVHIESTGTSIADFTITNRDGQQVAAGQAPMTIKLPAGSSYMQPERYTIHYSKPGFYPTYQIIEATINPWYFGNIVFGGVVVGMLIVDPLTGAMWRLEDDVTGHLLKDPNVVK